jgi:hypothetical protein
MRISQGRLPFTSEAMGRNMTDVSGTQPKTHWLDGSSRVWDGPELGSDLSGCGALT